MNHDNTRNRSNLPPLERLQQRNRDVERNVRQFDLSDNLLNITDISYNPFSNPFSSSSVEEKYKEKYKWITAYDKWRSLNLKAMSGELNSNKTYFSKHQSIRSIEYLLLQAIANDKKLETRTTKYSPGTGIVSLFSESLAWIDTETYHIQQVKLPAENTKLARHRLRQLGLRCIKVDDVNRLYLSEDYWVPVLPGKIIEIHKTYNKICLPELWYSKNIIELPRQANLFTSEWQVLSQFDGDINKHKYEIAVSIGGGNLHFNIRSKERNSMLTGVMHSLSHSISVAELTNIRVKNTIRNLVDKLVDKLKQDESDRQYSRFYSSVSGMNMQMSQQNYGIYPQGYITIPNAAVTATTYTTTATATNNMITLRDIITPAWNNFGTGNL